jgi:GNAT superfamily N-acetyltransferase
VIRHLVDSDISAAASLLERLSRDRITFEFSKEAADRFHDANDATAIAEHVSAGFRYHVAVDASGRLMGFIGMRDNSHIHHLFVDEAVQRTGLARKLWSVAREACVSAGNTSGFTVNASNNAVTVYEVFGFACDGAMRNDAGFLFNPMRLDTP